VHKQLPKAREKKNREKNHSSQKKKKQGGGGKERGKKKRRNERGGGKTQIPRQGKKKTNFITTGLGGGGTGGAKTRAKKSNRGRDGGKGQGTKKKSTWEQTNFRAKKNDQTNPQKQRAKPTNFGGLGDPCLMAKKK